MRVTVALSLALAGAASLTGVAWADPLEIPGEVPEMALPPSVPAKGMSMGAVLRQYGEPAVRHPTVGGGAPMQPPITRWDYAGFSVFFERQTVIDTVIEGAPAEVHRRDERVAN